MNSILHWLTRRRVPNAWSTSFRVAMASPWCWPRDASLADAVRALSPSLRPPSEPLPGEVLLVSIAAQGHRSTLWRLSWDKHKGDSDIPFHVPFHSGAHESLVRASSLAVTLAPHLHTLHSIEHLPRSAGFIFKRGDHSDAALDDASFGLSFFLAAVSSLTSRPVSPRFAATAALDETGGLFPVAGLEAKLSLLADVALSVDTVLVSSLQRDEAQRIARTLPRPLTVLAVSHASDALRAVFPDAKESPPRDWEDPKRRNKIAEQLFDLSRHTSRRLNWSALERSARWILACTEPTERAHTRARFAALIAARHANNDGIAMRWEDFVDPRRDHVHVIAAHVVQAAADAGLDELPEYIERARLLLPDELDEDSARILLGAIARGLAALRRYGEAARTFAEVTSSWFNATNPGGMSYPLSEWLRVAGILGDDASWREANAAAERYLSEHAESDSIGRSFVIAGLLRGHVLRNAPRVALDLARSHNTALAGAPPWLGRSIRRVCAQAHDACGAYDEARALRDALGEDANERAEVEGVFARLDATLTRGDDPSDAVKSVLDARPQGVRWILEGATTPLERARRLAREYPY